MNYLGSPRISLALRKQVADAALYAADCGVEMEVARQSFSVLRIAQAKANHEQAQELLARLSIDAAREYHATA